MRNLRLEMQKTASIYPLDRIRIALWMLVLLAMPMWPQALPGLLGLLMLAMVPWSKGDRAWQLPAWSSPLPWMAVWYLGHVLGMAWSRNQPHGLFDLEVKLLALIVPLLFAWNAAAWSRHSDLLLRVFVWAVSLTLLFLTLRSTWLFIEELQLRATGEYPMGLPYTNIFFSTYFSPWMHPSYLAMYAVLGLFVLAERSREIQRMDFLRALECRVLPVVLVLGILLAASKTGWIGLLMVPIYVLWSYRNDAHVRRKIVLVAFLAAGFFAVLVVSFGTVRAKFTDTWHALVTSDSAGEDSSTSRVLVWKAAIELIGRSPLVGTGTGDIKDELMGVYADRGYVYPLERRLNAHSQFLQTAVALGLPMALLLLAALLVPLVNALRTGQFQMAAFLVLTLLNWSVESMLEVQAGVVFFMLLAGLLTRATSEERYT